MALDARVPAPRSQQQRAPSTAGGKNVSSSFDPAVCPSSVENAADVIERVSFLDFLVRAPAQHAGKSQGNPRSMSWRPGDALKSEFEHVHRFDVANRSEALPGVAPDPLVHL